jgi:NurA domain
MLEFAALTAQMEKMLDDGRWRLASLPAALETARRACACRDEHGDFNGLIATARNAGKLPDSWHPARLFHSDAMLCEAQDPVDMPLPHFVAAADGSQIYPDAHRIADCYLLHISGIALRYGALHGEGRANGGALGSDAAGNALMRATPQFFYGAEDDPWHRIAVGGGGAINRELVDARRHIVELNELAALLERSPSDGTAIGLCDGVLDLRISAAQAWREYALDENGRALDALRQCGRPLAGYITASHATDVITGLRVALRAADADSNDGGDATLEALAMLTDTRLFNALLQPGQRSAAFVSSRGMAQHSNEMPRHHTCFFYLKANEGEVARLEFPCWVAERKPWLEQLHALTLEQIAKGAGYPVALMEAHEHAVVRAADREMFYQLLEELMIGRGLQPHRSTKNLSKSRPLV